MKPSETTRSSPPHGPGLADPPERLGHPAALEVLEFRAQPRTASSWLSFSTKLMRSASPRARIGAAKAEVITSASTTAACAYGDSQTQLKSLTAATKTLTERVAEPRETATPTHRDDWRTMFSSSFPTRSTTSWSSSAARSASSSTLLTRRSNNAPDGRTEATGAPIERHVVLRRVIPI